MTLPTLHIDDPAPSPDARMVAEIRTCDGDMTLCYRAKDGDGKRIAWIEWPRSWGEAKSVYEIEAAGFIIRAL